MVISLRQISRLLGLMRILERIINLQFCQRFDDWDAVAAVLKRYIQGGWFNWVYERQLKSGDCVRLRWSDIAYALLLKVYGPEDVQTRPRSLRETKRRKCFEFEDFQAKIAQQKNQKQRVSRSWIRPAKISRRGASPKQIEGSDRRNLHLRFRSKVSLPLFTGGKVEGEQGASRTLGQLPFTDNSSWIRSRKFRLGLKVVSGYCEGALIPEAETEASTIEDHRGEYFVLHDLDSLGIASSEAPGAVLCLPAPPNDHIMICIFLETLGVVEFCFNVLELNRVSDEDSPGNAIEDTNFTA